MVVVDGFGLVFVGFGLAVVEGLGLVDVVGLGFAVVFVVETVVDFRIVVDVGVVVELMFLNSVVESFSEVVKFVLIISMEGWVTIVV